MSDTKYAPPVPSFKPEDVKDGKLPSGNAALVCSACRGICDKGCPPIEGQSDAGFVCHTCTEAGNDVERARRTAEDAKFLAEKAPTLVMDGASHGAELKNES